MTTATALDARDVEILTARQDALDLIDGIRVGDFVRFADGIERRVSYVWDLSPEPDGIQTSDSGSYYLGLGYVSMSGGLHSGIPADMFTATDEIREGHVWFFHHDFWGAGRGVETTARFRVFTCSRPAKP